MAQQNNAASFWSSITAEPKRSYKYLVRWANNDIPWFLVSSIDQPKAEVGQAETHALYHTFKWPGRITWQDINLEVTDSESLNAARVLVDKLIQSGYAYPQSPNSYRTISKAGSVGAFGQLTIQEITWDEKIIGEWKLLNAWVKSFDLGKKAYESDDAQKISMSITYDWAEYTAYNPPVAINGQQ